jgi:tryptophanyl-tRNA synthetase
MCRDIASSFNNQYGEVFVLPEARISKDTMIVPGTDGRKMSKSYDNFINIFLDEKSLKKQVFSITTDSTPLEEPKDAESCLVYQLFELIANDVDAKSMKDKLEAGNYGYGHAKKDLLGYIIEHYSEQRMLFNEFMNDPLSIENKLSVGAEKASTIAKDVLNRVKAKTGFNSN